MERTRLNNPERERKSVSVKSSQSSEPSYVLKLPSKESTHTDTFNLIQHSLLDLDETWCTPKSKRLER